MDNNTQTPLGTQPPVQNNPSVTTKPPQQYTPVHVGKFVTAAIVAILISWGIIGGFLWYVLANDIVGKTVQNVNDTMDDTTQESRTGSSSSSSSRSSTSSKDETAFMSISNNVKVTESTVKVGDYTIELTGAGKEKWKFIDKRGTTDINCSNAIKEHGAYCNFILLTQKSNNTDVQPFTLGTLTTIPEFKDEFSSYKVGTRINIPGAKEALVYNAEPDYSNRYHAYAVLISLTSDYGMYIAQLSEDAYFYPTQAALDSDKYTSKYKMLFSDVEEVINSIKITK